jgi:hypothetical protein
MMNERWQSNRPASSFGFATNTEELSRLAFFLWKHPPPDGLDDGDAHGGGGCSEGSVHGIRHHRRRFGMQFAVGSFVFGSRSKAIDARPSPDR